MTLNTYTSAGAIVSSGPLVAAGLVLIAQEGASAATLLTGAFLAALGVGIALSRESRKPASEESRKAIKKVE